MATKVTEQHTHDQLVIQGLLKEAQLLEVPITITWNSIQVSSQVLQIQENGIRDQSDQKLIILKYLGANEIHNKQTIKISFGLYRFFVSGSCEVTNTSDGIIVVTIPKSLLLSNVRNKRRKQIDDRIFNPVAALVRTGDLHCESRLEVKNFSETGIGCRISVPKGFPIASGTFVQTQIHSPSGSLKIRGVVVKAHEAQSSDRDHQLYDIGIQQSDQTLETNQERRRFKRFEGDFKLHFTSTLGHGAEFELQITDVSISGLAAIRPIDSNAAVIPLGAQLRERESKLLFDVVSINSNSIHLAITQITGSTPLEWLRKITKLISTTSTPYTQHPEDLFKIFLQAGSISSDYIERHKNVGLKLLDNNGPASNSLTHRWYMNDDSGAPQAYISAIRFGDNVWCLGDLAKERETVIPNDNPKNFYRSFFRSFSEFSRITRPSPLALVAWTSEHPVWLEWDRALINELKDSVVCANTVGYTRIKKSTFESLSSKDVRIQEVTSSDSKLIHKTTEMLNDVGCLDFTTTALDFTMNTFGSPRLAELSRGEKFIFDRRYFIITIHEQKYFSCITKYPTGLSINRVPDSCFVVELNPSTHCEWLCFKQEICQLANSIGVALPSIRRIGILNSETLKPGESVLLRQFLITPSGLEGF